MDIAIIQKKIFGLRGHKVMLDFDLARGCLIRRQNR
jgi:hypothetical protein